MQRYIWIVLFLMVLPSATLASQTTSTARDLHENTILREHVVNEPIFQGQAYILEAGSNNSTGILLVHGLGDEASTTWSKLIPQLAKDYHVIAVDLPGFGKSEKQNKLYSPASYAAFLKWVADRFLPGPLVVVGHSLGGAVAIKFVSSYPDKIEKLILANVAGILHRRIYANELIESGVRKKTANLPVSLPGLDNVVGSFISKIPELPVSLNFVLSNSFMRNKILGGNPEKIAALALIEEDFSTDLRRIKVPCHIIWGENDSVTPLRTGIMLEAVIPDAVLQIIPDTGHVPMRDRPKLFNQAIISAITTDTPRPQRQKTNHQIGKCTKQNGMSFTGKFDRLEISGCREVTLKDISCGYVDIRQSDVTFERGTLKSDQTAMFITDSTLKATGTRFEAPRAIVASRSRLDLAGVELISETAAISTPDHSTVVFSVSRVKSPHMNGFIHGPTELTVDTPL